MSAEVDAHPVIDSKNHMTVLHIQSITGNALGAELGHTHTAGRAETGLAGKADNIVVVAVRAFVNVKAHFESAAVNHSLNLTKDAVAYCKFLIL